MIDPFTHPTEYVPLWEEPKDAPRCDLCDGMLMPGDKTHEDLEGRVSHFHCRFGDVR
jgi:hypothetical protein